MSFTNLYYKRTAGSSKACYVCYKPTTTVLATINTVDFLYTCDGHLKDSNFASQVGESGDGAEGTRKMGLSPEELAKVKAEWEEKQKKKAEKEKEKEKEKADEKEKDKDKDKEKEKEKKESSKSPPPASTSSGTSTPAPTHERYTLHRDFFAMRLGEHRRRRQAAQAKEIAPRLPSAPTGNIS
ncbi:DUF1742-domain-containing protein [Pluteus cervinus]|uniref:DUF1742-domain-containing protein n=1 Tax=Pluteus cervinus TaxID=181527 RepID=A0ACD3B8X1_9AGAR|nr:DUF1742-domain-containing protein [Pluteus cervinus]